MKNKLITAALIVSLTGCASHTWTPGPNVSQPWDQASGTCKEKAIAGAGSPGFAGAAGQPLFVAAAVGTFVVLGAIATSARQHQIYDSCMEGAGYMIADSHG